jgi:hypothetical protein
MGRPAQLPTGRQFGFGDGRRFCALDQETRRNLRVPSVCKPGARTGPAAAHGILGLTSPDWCSSSAVRLRLVELRLDLPARLLLPEWKGEVWRRGQNVVKIS